MIWTSPPFTVIHPHLWDTFGTLNGTSSTFPEIGEPDWTAKVGRPKEAIQRTRGARCDSSISPQRRGPVPGAFALLTAKIGFTGWRRPTTTPRLTGAKSSIFGRHRTRRGQGPGQGACGHRTTTCPKAALNLAADNDDRIARRPWETGLLALRDADRSRNVVLNDDQVRRVVAAAYGRPRVWAVGRDRRRHRCSRESTSAARGSGRAGRPRRPASDDAELTQGGIKSIGRRPVPIPATLALRLRAIAGKRHPDAPLLLKPSGDAWRKSDH